MPAVADPSPKRRPGNPWPAGVAGNPSPRPAARNIDEERRITKARLIRKVGHGGQVGERAIRHLKELGLLDENDAKKIKTDDKAAKLNTSRLPKFIREYIERLNETTQRLIVEAHANIEEIMFRSVNGFPLRADEQIVADAVNAWNEQRHEKGGVQPVWAKPASEQPPETEEYEGLTPPPPPAMPQPVAEPPPAPPPPAKLTPEERRAAALANLAKAKAALAAKKGASCPQKPQKPPKPVKPKP